MLWYTTHGWTDWPAYTEHKDPSLAQQLRIATSCWVVCRETKLLRAVIREDMSMAMVDELIKDITRAVEYLDSHFTINVNDVHKPEGKSLAVSPAT